MKKLLAVLLAILALLTFSACGNSVETEPDPETEIDTQPVTETEPDTETQEVPDSETEPETEIPVSNIYVDRDEIVYVTGANILNVRSAAELDPTNIVGTLKEGDSVKRVAYSEDWSKIIFNEKEYFASSKYLSLHAPLEFAEANETVYVKVENSVNLRSKAWADSEALAILVNGMVLTRTGVAKDADEFGSVWSRVTYIEKDGKAVEGYVNSKYLTTEPPLSFTDINEMVVIVNCDTLNLRAEASVDSKTLASLPKDTELQRIGVAKTADADGIVWSRLMHEGNICFANSEYLSLKTADTETTETVDQH